MDQDDAFVLLAYGDRTRLVPRPADYAAAEQLARAEFGLPEDASLTFAVDWRGRRAEIGRNAFDVVRRAEQLFITVGPQPVALLNSRPAQGVTTPPPDEAESTNGRMMIKIVVGGDVDRTLNFTVKPSTQFSKIRQAAENSLGLCPDSLRLLWEGRRVGDRETLINLNFKDGDTLWGVPEQKGGKPVIYIQSPHDVEQVSVELALIPEWKFSAVYPVVDPKVQEGRSVVQWEVAAKASGELTDKASGLQLSYLFWEATSVPERPLTPSYGHVEKTLSFNPARPSLTPENAMVLAFTPFLQHLDRALTSLGLHVSARNDFITFWLPHFVRIHESGKDVAFRFLPQVDYEAAAHLKVSPAPEVMTRVFLLFGGADTADDAWTEARRRTDVNWKDVVGVSDDVLDTSKFRVLEWGGMEVHLI